MLRVIMPIQSFNEAMIRLITADIDVTPLILSVRSCRPEAVAVAQMISEEEIRAIFE